MCVCDLLQGRGSNRSVYQMFLTRVVHNRLDPSIELSFPLAGEPRSGRERHTPFGQMRGVEWGTSNSLTCDKMGPSGRLFILPGLLTGSLGGLSGRSSHCWHQSLLGPYQSSLLAGRDSWRRLRFGLPGDFNASRTRSSLGKSLLWSCLRRGFRFSGQTKSECLILLFFEPRTTVTWRPRQS